MQALPAGHEVSIYVCRGIKTKTNAKAKEEILRLRLKNDPPSLKLRQRTTRLRVPLRRGNHPGKRRGKPVTIKDYFYYFLLSLDEKKQKSPTVR